MATDRTPADDTAPGKGAKGDVEAFLRRVVKQFARVEAAEAQNRSKALDDLKFKSGEQWPEAIRAQRTLDKRPCLTINKMKTFTHQITNDQRQNRPSINVSPVGDKSDPETAKMLKGLIRQIERASNADVAYDTGFDSAVSGGWGYWRILSEYEDDASFNQVLRVKRVRNPFRIYLDPDHQEPDGSDAKWGFITDLITREQFKQQYPNADPVQWEERGLGEGYEAWNTLTHVRIAEYYCFETKTRKLVALENGHVGYEDELDPSLADAPRKDEREVSVKTCRWYTLTAKEILDENEWLGKWIPIVKVIGDEIDIEGELILAGLIRDAKDPQRMYNYWSTSETEMIGLAPKAPWLIEEGQIEGYERMWKEANIKSLPYLLYKSTNNAGHPSPPPQRQQFEGPPVGVVNAKLAASQDMQAVTGIRFDATLQERTYDESGKALRELKRVGDLGSFHYVDNLARSLRHTGQMLVDLIPKVYDTPRILTILREDDSEERVKVDPQLGVPYQKSQLPDGRLQRLFNPKLGEYEVVVSVGPSFATKRAEAADSMLGFMKAVPQSGPLIGDLIAKNMDWPGADEIAARLMASLPPGMLDKKLESLPPEAKGMIMNLTQQLQQLKQERDQAVSMLGDKDKDRALEAQGLQNDREQMARDFEAKMAKVQEDMHTKMAALQVQLLIAGQTSTNGPDPQLEADKLDAEYDTKVLKIAADYDAKRMAVEAKAAERAQAQAAETERMKKQADAVNVIKQDVGSRMDKLEKMLEDIANTEIVFKRDPKTNRIAGATRQKKAH